MPRSPKSVITSYFNRLEGISPQVPQDLLVVARAIIDIDEALLESRRAGDHGHYVEILDLTRQFSTALTGIHTRLQQAARAGHYIEPLTLKVFNAAADQFARGTGIDVITRNYLELRAVPTREALLQNTGDPPPEKREAVFPASPSLVNAA